MKLPYDFDLLYDVKSMRDVEDIAAGRPSRCEVTREELIALFKRLDMHVPSCLQLDPPVLAAHLDQFTRSYIQAMIWASTDEDDRPMDEDYNIDDLAPETLERIKVDCLRFVTAYRDVLRKVMGFNSYDWGSAGHDFWLTRCGHGAGFWDRGMGEHGDELTEACEVYGNLDLYVGDDDQLYLS